MTFYSRKIIRLINTSNFWIECHHIEILTWLIVKRHVIRVSLMRSFLVNLRPRLQEFEQVKQVNHLISVRTWWRMQASNFPWPTKFCMTMKSLMSVCMRRSKAILSNSVNNNIVYWCYLIGWCRHSSRVSATSRRPLWVKA